MIKENDNLIIDSTSAGWKLYFKIKTTEIQPSQAEKQKPSEF